MLELIVGFMVLSVSVIGAYLFATRKVRPDVNHTVKIDGVCACGSTEEVINGVCVRCFWVKAHDAWPGAPTL
jgi:hypothetical protein